MRAAGGRQRVRLTRGPTTLAFDIGGTSVKARCFDELGRARGPLRRADTPKPATPAALLRVLLDLAAASGPFERLAAGFPGVVRAGRVRTAPNLGGGWPGRNLVRDFERGLGRPARVANDAVLHGLGATRGRGVELLLTLGTGLGSVLLVDGRALPLELGHLPWTGGRTFEQHLGEAGRRRVGTSRWSALVGRAVATLAAALEPDVVLLGGGNAERLRGRVPPGSRLVPNRAALRGGWRLWAGAAQRERKMK